jgi:hypothetical protein
MERGLYPHQIKISLESYGLRCKRVLPKPVFNRSGLKGLLKDVFLSSRYWVKGRFSPWFLKIKAEGFQMIGVKE